LLISVISQLAEQYGTDVAADMLARSRSNINLNVNTSQLDAMAAMPYDSPTSTKSHVKYDSIGTRTPTTI